MLNTTIVYLLNEASGRDLKRRKVVVFVLLKNVTRDILFEKLGEILRCHPEICSCARCQLDIAAIALNHLPPRYVVTPIGEVITRTGSLDAQISVDTMLELTKAIAIVSRFPRHAENSHHQQ